MPKRKIKDAKWESLHEQGCVNPQADDVIDPLFTEHDFFDARDLVQVRYEMLRRVREQGDSVTDAVSAFGFSRQSFYNIQRSFDDEGMPGLVPKKRGPHGGHKLTAEVIGFLQERLAEQPDLPSASLARLLEDELGVIVHPRSIERALERREKKRL